MWVIIGEMKFLKTNFMGRLKIKLQKKKRIRELEDRLMEIIQIEKQRGKND